MIWGFLHFQPQLIFKTFWNFDQILYFELGKKTTQFQTKAIIEVYSKGNKSIDAFFFEWRFPRKLILGFLPFQARLVLTASAYLKMTWPVQRTNLNVCTWISTKSLLCTTGIGIPVNVSHNHLGKIFCEFGIWFLLEKVVNFYQILIMHGGNWHCIPQSFR